MARSSAESRTLVFSRGEEQGHYIWKPAPPKRVADVIAPAMFDDEIYYWARPRIAGPWALYTRGTSATVGSPYRALSPPTRRSDVVYGHDGIGIVRPTPYERAQTSRSVERRPRYDERSPANPYVPPGETR